MSQAKTYHFNNDREIELFNERAGILQYDALFSLEEAEALAYNEILEARNV